MTNQNFSRLTTAVFGNICVNELDIPFYIVEAFCIGTPSQPTGVLVRVFISQVAEVIVVLNQSCSSRIADGSVVIQKKISIRFQIRRID